MSIRVKISTPRSSVSKNDAPVCAAVRNRRFPLITAFAALFVASATLAADAVWNGTSDATWAGANWSASPVPGSGDTASFTNTFAIVSARTTIDLGDGVIVNKILFDKASCAAYTLGAGAVGSQTLTLNNSGMITNTSTVINDQQFNCAIALGDATTHANTICNLSTTKKLTFAGNISGGSGGTPGTNTLQVIKSTVNPSQVDISGNIGNGGASAVALEIRGAGSLTLTGSNSIAGATTIYDSNKNNTYNTLILAGSGSLSSSKLYFPATRALFIITNSAVATFGAITMNCVPGTIIATKQYGGTLNCTGGDSTFIIGNSGTGSATYDLYDGTLNATNGVVLVNNDGNSSNTAASPMSKASNLGKIVVTACSR